ncbi:MAG TPA: MBL fold metallo-hydrolase [Thermoanaerobaculia bacterium]|nr:MBL fold metallo-hydrolase [Thermoanaerobaculia bacterium]
MGRIGAFEEVAMSGWKIGSVAVTPVIELTLPIPGSFLIPQATPEALAPYREWLLPGYMTEDGLINLTIQAFLVESRGRKIIVDTCVGNGKTRSVPQMNELDTPFLDHITDAGFPPEKVDTVICTHLHVDHVGWNTKQVDGRWVPTFPNARYVMARTDYDYWSQAADPEAAAIFGDSVRPVFEAGLVDLVDAGHQITPEIGLLPTPGHTPGHCSVTISSSGGEEGVITGDVMHHPSQCMHPEWDNNFDSDREQAKRTRLGFLERYGSGAVRVIGTHFGTPAATRIVPSGDRWKVEGHARASGASR